MEVEAYKRKESQPSYRSKLGHFGQIFEPYKYPAETSKEHECKQELQEESSRVGLDNRGRILGEYLFWYFLGLFLWTFFRGRSAVFSANMLLMCKIWMIGSGYIFTCSGWEISMSGGNVARSLKFIMSKMFIVGSNVWAIIEWFKYLVWGRDSIVFWVDLRRMWA